MKTETLQDLLDHQIDILPFEDTGADVFGLSGELALHGTEEGATLEMRFLTGVTEVQFIPPPMMDLYGIGDYDGAWLSVYVDFEDTGTTYRDALDALYIKAWRLSLALRTDRFEKDLAKYGGHYESLDENEGDENHDEIAVLKDTRNPNLNQPI